MKTVFLTMLFCATIQTNAATLNTLTCTGENPKDYMGTLTLDLDRQIFISSKTTNDFGDETLGLQKQKTKGGNLIYRASDPEGEFILTFYVPEKFIPISPRNPETFTVKLKFWMSGDGDSGSVNYLLKCAAAR